MLKIVITGGGGLLGNQFLKAFEKKYDIHAIVRKLPAIQHPDVNYHVIDLKNPDFKSLPGTADAVFHLAQSQHMREFPEMAMDIFQVNVGSTVALLDYAQRAKASTFVLASTGGLYKPMGRPINENDPIDIINGGPLSFYFSSKHCAETLVEGYSIQFNTVILRPFFIYGSGQKPSMLVPRLIQNIKNGVPIELRGDHGTTLNPIHVEDAALALEASLHLRGSARINLAGPDVTSIRGMCEQIGSLLSTPPQFVHREGPADYLAADISRLSSLLCQPSRNFAEGVASMINQNAPYAI